MEDKVRHHPENGAFSRSQTGEGIIRQFIAGLPQDRHSRARRLIGLLETLTLREPHSSEKPMRNWQNLDLAATFLNSADDLRDQKRLLRITQHLKQLSPDEATRLIAHFLDKTSAAPVQPRRIR